MTQDVVDWLLESDPAMRWQVMRDLLDAPESEWQAERARIETEGWGARLFALQGDDGQWAGGAFVPAGFTEQKWREEGQPWTATCWVLAQLREFGLEPTAARSLRTARLVGDHSRWDHDGQPYWEGEVEECINGRTVEIVNTDAEGRLLLADAMAWAVDEGAEHLVELSTLTGGPTVGGVAPGGVSPGATVATSSGNLPVSSSTS